MQVARVAEVVRVDVGTRNRSRHLNRDHRRHRHRRHRHRHHLRQHGELIQLILAVRVAMEGQISD